MDGLLVGDTTGAADGAFEGVPVGSEKVGLELGVCDGRSEGSPVGETEGVPEGCLLGDFEGCPVGSCAVGLIEGVFLTQKPRKQSFHLR